MIHIDVIRESDDKMRRQVWRFWYFDNRHALVLDTYSMQSRDSLRKKFKVDSIYNRIDRRDSTINEGAVDMPADVVKEALDKFVTALRIARWSEVK